MQPENYQFGGGLAESMIHPLVLVALILAIILMFVLPRRKVIQVVLYSAFLIPLGQVIVVAGAHWTVIRVIMAVGCIRVLMLPRVARPKPERWYKSVGFAFMAWALISAVVYVIRWQDMGAVINRCGVMIDIAGTYFVMSRLVRDFEDVQETVRAYAVVCSIVAVVMLVEQATQVDLFGLLGGVREYPEVRKGLVRAQGIFQHPIIAGTFGATVLPLFIGLRKIPRLRRTMVIGIVSAIIIAVTPFSSTPLLALLAGIGALCLWPARGLMRWLRWGIVLMLVSLHMVMNGPVWALISRVDVVGSSSSDHRYALVNNFITHFSEWWLIGTKDPGSWGWDMWDMSNQYVAIGVGGGLIGLALFLWFITRAYSNVGNARKHTNDPNLQWFYWSLGAALFAHTVAFFGTSYWDQIQISWYLLLVIIAASTKTIPAMRPLVAADAEGAAGAEHDLIEAHGYPATLGAADLETPA
jgi:hypothetical protein